MVDPIITAIAGTLSGLKSGLEILTKDPIRKKLLSQPDPAAQQLCSVMSKLEAMYLEMEKELSSYSGLEFWSDMDKRDYAEVYSELNRLMPYALQARFRSSKASCTTIQNIYHNFLRGWFTRVLNPQEQNELKTLFEIKLGEGDETFVELLNSVAYLLGDRAQEVKKLLEEGKWQEAIDYHHAERKKLEQCRRILAQVWINMADFRNEFQAVAGPAVGG